MSAISGFYRTNQYAPVSSSLDLLNPGYSTSHTMQGRSALHNGKEAKKVAEDVNSVNPNLKASRDGVSAASARAAQNAMGASSRANDLAQGRASAADYARGSSDSTYGNAGIKTEADAMREAANETKKQTLDQEDFLRLLTAQLAAQDPTKPADNTELVSQMSQLSMVESLNSLNTYMADMIESVTSSSALGATSLIGKYVLTEDNKAFFSGGNVLNWKVDAGDKTYYNVEVKVKDAATGEVVFIDHADSLTGTINWGWLGIHAPNGLDENGYPIGDDGKPIIPPVDGGGETVVPPIGEIPGEGGSGAQTLANTGFNSGKPGEGGNPGSGGDGSNGGDGNGGEGGDKPVEGGDKPGNGGDNGEGGDKPKPNYEFCAAGKYVLEVTGTDASGATVQIPTRAFAQVTAVTLDKTLEGTMLTLFGMGSMSYADVEDITTL